MRYLRFALALVVVVLVHSGGAHLGELFPRILDLFVVLVVLQGLQGSPVGGLACGAVAGLAHDVLTGGPYGLYGFADTIIGYLTARAGQRLILESPVAVMVVVMVAVLAQQGILLALSALLLTHREPPALLWWGIRAVASGLVAFVVHLGSGALLGARERYRRDRGQRLRFDR